MVDVKKFIESAGGNWLRADNVQVNDKLEILGPGRVDDETFDSAYLVVPMKLLRTGEEYSVRLGPKNAERVADGLGTEKTEEWPGRQVEVISIETYRGLGTKGFILRGLPPQPKQTELRKADPPSDEISEDVVRVIRRSSDVIDMGLPLNEQDWSESLPVKVRAELLKKGLAEKKGNLYFFVAERVKRALK